MATGSWNDGYSEKLDTDITDNTDDFQIKTVQPANKK
jgi:hypothetical protein